LSRSHVSQTAIWRSPLSCVHEPTRNLHNRIARTQWGPLHRRRTGCEKRPRFCTITDCESSSHSQVNRSRMQGPRLRQNCFAPFSNAPALLREEGPLPTALTCHTLECESISEAARDYVRIVRRTSACCV